MWVNIAGILSPILQQSLSVVVRRSSSAHAPCFMLGGVKEWTFTSRDTVKDGPQVDIGDLAIVSILSISQKNPGGTWPMAQNGTSQLASIHCLGFQLLITQPSLSLLGSPLIQLAYVTGVSSPQTNCALFSLLLLAPIHALSWYRLYRKPPVCSSLIDAKYP